MKAVVYVTLKSGILDAQGKTIQHSLHSTGFPGVKDVRQGKYFELLLDADNEEEAKRDLENICSKILANPVIEDFRFELSK